MSTGMVISEAVVRDAAPNLPWIAASAAADLNQCVTTGVWAVGNTTLNRPPGMTYGILRCTVVRKDILLQELFELGGSGRSWNRTNNGYNGSKTEITTAWYVHTPVKVT